MKFLSFVEHNSGGNAVLTDVAMKCAVKATEGFLSMVQFCRP